MELLQKLALGKPDWLIERRAALCRDPVDRLRYLRHAQAGIPESKSRKRSFAWKRLALMACLLVVVMPLPTISNVMLTRDVQPVRAAVNPANATPPDVWLVEQTDNEEIYSNGLRIDTTYTVASDTRPYPVYDRETLDLKEWRSGPVGILYHTTESNQAPFDPGHRDRLQRLSRNLLAYVKREKAYHYVIDRFGGVHRVVRESGSANHSGYSIWADEDKVYVNLNPSFIGVSFEAGTDVSSEGGNISTAQVRAGRDLTEMLRAKYGIPAHNCVTHAQVSVAPSIYRVGNHLDWSGGFPFAELGLEQNYQIPQPAIGVFGFRFDNDFLGATGPEFWTGILLGEDEFRQRAAAHGESVQTYRRKMQSRYRNIIRAVEGVASAVERTS